VAFWGSDLHFPGAQCPFTGSLGQGSAFQRSMGMLVQHRYQQHSAGDMELSRTVLCSQRPHGLVSIVTQA
jgi:hypothetical protein